ncbi:MAG TPA: response regulator transcription factor [Acetobacteraceae bacterium]|jgi:DNA-binding NarL/FixJ family response regulator
MEEDQAEVGVLIADRLTFYRHGLAALLRDSRPGWSLAEAGTFTELLDRLDQGQARLVLIDLQLPGMDRADGVRRLRQMFPNRSFVVLSDDDGRATILECLAAGAQGFVLKSTTPTQFLRAIDTILSGAVFAPASLSNAPFHPPVPHSRIDVPPKETLAPLTDRQRAVFALLAEGCATKEIARRLDLAIGTVKVHLAAIYRALGARSRLEAVAKARGNFTMTSMLLSGSLRTADRLN